MHLWDDFQLDSASYVHAKGVGSGSRRTLFFTFFDMNIFLEGYPNIRWVADVIPVQSDLTWTFVE